MSKILIIDDEAPILNLMAKSCSALGHEVSAVLTFHEGIEALDRISPDLLIVDLKLGELDGRDIIRYSVEKHPRTQIIMVTGNGSLEIAVDTMRLGAFDYLPKPFELADLHRTVEAALHQKGTPLPARTSSNREESLVVKSPGLIGQSPKILEILQTIRKIASSDSPVLLEGEFGSGKQMVARSIHDAGSRTQAPFKVLQCSALPEDLLEAELFGTSQHRVETIFVRAAGGTVLLEEIHELPLRLQSKLEAFLEEISTRRSLNNLPANMDVRLIASSAASLQERVEAGLFRADLYYKISVIPVTVPPLRSRSEDVGLLAEHFLRRFTERTGTPMLEIDKYARRLLEGYSWPGNVGELQNAMERACAFAEDGRIRPTDLPPKVTQKVEITDDDQKAVHHLPIGTALSDYIRKQEKMFIRETLKYNEGSREKAASMLGVSIATLYRKMGLKLEKDKMLG
jgi:DNA-binding NtrC family response regulator